jgi:hypothetical protein
VEAGHNRAHERNEGAVVQQLRLDTQLGIYSVTVAPESVGIFQGLGMH